jgi:hypothetical protein
VAASRLEAPASPFAQISTPGPLADLHIRLEEGHLELWATSPPSELRIQLSGDHRARRMRLNGHDVRLPENGANGLTVRAAQWGVTSERSGATGRDARAAIDPSPEAIGAGVSC